MSQFDPYIIAFLANSCLLTPMHLSACPQQLELNVVGHVKGMNVPAKFYASPELLKLVSNEFRTATGGFTGAVQQLANVATLPGFSSSFSPQLSLLWLCPICHYKCIPYGFTQELWEARLECQTYIAGMVLLWVMWLHLIWRTPKQSYLLEGWGSTSTVVSDCCAQVCFSKLSTISHIVGCGIFHTSTSIYCKLYSQLW